MSVPVAISALAARIEEFGMIAYLVTVAADGRAHIVSVRVGWDGAELVMGAGRKTSANIDHDPRVTLVWAAPAAGSYSLIVDGTARSIDGSEPATLGISPTAAVLHRTPDGDPTGPPCVAVLPTQ